MADKSIPKKNNLNIKNSQIDLAVLDLLDHLKDRPREVLTKRFGLDGSEPMVLNQIGRSLGVTRERIRQIEDDSFRKLKRLKKGNQFKEILDKAENFLENRGGFSEKTALKKGLKNPLSKKEKNQLMFILNSSAKLGYNKGNLAVGGFWFLQKRIKPEQIIEIHNHIIGHLKSERQPRTFSNLYSFLLQSQWKNFFGHDKGKNRLVSILGMSRVLRKNILGQWGIKNWRIISERGVREKAYLVLKKYNKPYHFSQITELINQHWQIKTALPQTVHNELIKDKRFILVGRGTYGLKEWKNYMEGTVRNIIIDFFQKNNKPAHRDIIVNYVLKRKRVKKATVLVNLADRDLFRKDSRGYVVLTRKK